MFPEQMPRSDSAAIPERPLPGDLAHQVFSAYSLPRRLVRRAPQTRLLTWGMAGEELRRAYCIPWPQGREAEFLDLARKTKRRQAWIPGTLRRRNGRKQRRRTAERLREIQFLSYTDVKAREMRQARANAEVT